MVLPQKIKRRLDRARREKFPRLSLGPTRDRRFMIFMLSNARLILNRTFRCFPTTLLKTANPKADKPRGAKKVLPLIGGTWRHRRCGRGGTISNIRQHF